MFDVPVRKTPLGSRAMTQEELQEFLQHICYGNLSFIGEEGWPDSRVLNFFYMDGAFYCHGNKAKGERLKYWTDGAKVCLSFFEPAPDVGKRRYCQHESVLVYGTIHRIDIPNSATEEGYHALEGISFGGGTPFKAIPERLARTSRGCSVFRINPVHIIGKLTVFTTRPEKSYLETLHQGE